MTYIKGSGQIIYDPYRGNMKKRTNGWCVINLDDDIARYYRWWLEYQYHIRLQSPAWGAHVSVIRGEHIQDDKKFLWKKYHKQTVELEYEHGNIQVYRSGRTDDDMVLGDYHVISVKCPTIDLIRQELGLKVFDNYHLTIGRDYEYVSRHASGKRNQPGK